MLLDLCYILFGYVCAALESRENALPNFLLNFIKQEMHILYACSGRGVLYIFFGVVFITETFDVLLCFLGYMLAVLGCAVVVTTYNAEKGEVFFLYTSPCTSPNSLTLSLPL